MNTCGSCQFYICDDNLTENGKKYGHCHFNPPVSPALKQMGVYPYVRAGALGCSHHKVIEPGAEQENNGKKYPPGKGRIGMVKQV